MSKKLGEVLGGGEIEFLLSFAGRAKAVIERGWERREGEPLAKEEELHEWEGGNN